LKPQTRRNLHAISFGWNWHHSVCSGLGPRCYPSYKFPSHNCETSHPLFSCFQIGVEFGKVGRVSLVSSFGCERDSVRFACVTRMQLLLTNRTTATKQHTTTSFAGHNNLMWMTWPICYFAQQSIISANRTRGATLCASVLR
jgi:hypothetical protein